MLLFLVLIFAFGLLVLVSIALTIYSLLKKNRRILYIAITLFSIGTIACVFSAFFYSKKAIEYVQSTEFQEDTRKGTQIIGETIGSATSGISDGLSTTLDDKAIESLARKSATIFGKVTKTIASSFDSTLGSKSLFLDKSLENSGLELGRAEEKYDSKTNDLGVFISYKKDFTGKLRLTNYDQNGNIIEIVDKTIDSKTGKGEVEIFTFSHSSMGLTTYYILSKID